MKFYLTKILYLLLILMSSILHGDNSRPVAISLGSSCIVTAALRHHGIRFDAYPFDWVISPFSGLYKLLDGDFADFFLKENLDLISIGKACAISDTSTGFLYFHDFPFQEDNFRDVNQEIMPGHGHIVKNFLDYYEAVNEKYWRRIHRLRAILNSSAKVIFIRHSTTKEEALSLRDLFQRKYPDLDFTLAIIGVKVQEEPWSEPNIRNYYIPENFLGDLNAKEWLDVLYDLKLLGS